jgi:hypothetical protein
MSSRTCSTARRRSRSRSTGCSPAHTRSWHPYLYWDLLVGLAVADPHKERAAASLIAAWEESMLAAGMLSPPLLRFVATSDDQRAEAANPFPADHARTRR